MSKQDEDLNFNLKSILNNYSNAENKYEIDSFLNLIKQKQSNSVYIVKFLQQLKQCVSMLDPRLFEHNLINSIFNEIKWHVHYSRNQEVLTLFSEFLVDLNSAYTSYIYKCFSMLVKLFSVVNDNTSPDQLDCEAVCNLAHNVIHNLFQIAPTCKMQLVKIIEQGYPYMIKESSIQRSYISNLLRLASTYDELRLMMLEICIQKLLKIDVNSTREQIIEAELLAVNNGDVDLIKEEGI